MADQIPWLLGKCALIVDDEPDLRDLLAEELTLHGAQTVVARNAVEAVEISKSMKIDVVISDMHMPDGDGLALLKSISEWPAKPPVLLVTGHAEITAEEAKRLGAIDILSKPFSFSQLRERIRKVLDPSV